MARTRYGSSTVVLMCVTCQAMAVGTVIVRPLDRVRGRACALLLGLLDSASPNNPPGVKNNNNQKASRVVHPQQLVSSCYGRPTASATREYVLAGGFWYRTILSLLARLGRSVLRPSIPFWAGVYSTVVAEYITLARSSHPLPLCKMCMATTRLSPLRAEEHPGVHYWYAEFGRERSGRWEGEKDVHGNGT